MAILTKYEIFAIFLLAFSANVILSGATSLFTVFNIGLAVFILYTEHKKRKLDLEDYTE